MSDVINRNIQALNEELKKQRAVNESQDKVIAQLRSELSNMTQIINTMNQDVNILKATSNMNTVLGRTT